MTTPVYDDWRAETQTRLRRSALYQALKAKCEGDPAGAQVLTLVDDATFFAFQKTKTILIHMGEFTLHDGDHLFRVLLLMEKLLSTEQITELSIPELLLLILSAFFHDIGMAAEERDVAAWKKVWDACPTFASDEEALECGKFQRHCDARPDQIARVDELTRQGNHSSAELLRSYLISDYIRATHADRARQIIKKHWLDRIKYRDTDLAVEFANICFSHNEDASTVLDFDRRYLCGPDTYACLPLVAAILRLADLLDFDGKRTPAVLFSHLFVRHPVSIREWNKHRAVEAWSISSKEVLFHAKCSHPAIQSAIHAFCDAIDKELSTCNNVLAAINDFHRIQGRNLEIRLPLKVDRSRIVTRKTIDGKPEFLYRETQFTLSKSQVIDLLMGTKLYGSPEVALRELLQNSIDACLLRGALEKSWENPYEPEIVVRYFNENDEDILEIIDNGTGMDQDIIDSYYTRVGSSFYKSAEFFALKAQSKAEFVPTSRFGIGILSCFMVADTIVVDTRRVIRPHESREPLNVTIEGQESIFWIKPGERETPGTSTRLFLRRNKHPWQRMNDEQFINAVESVVPNPPFRIRIESHSKKKIRDQRSFELFRAESLKDYSWDNNSNVRVVPIEFSDPTVGFVGSGMIALLVRKGFPVAQLEMTSKTVSIDGEEYKLEKTLSLSGKEVSVSTSSIEIDENGLIEKSSSSSRIFHSKSRISLHGIEIPTSLFPDYWGREHNQLSLEMPIPALLVLDVCGSMDLDLNSSRTQIVMGDKWASFEESLYLAICQALATLGTNKYHNALRKVLVSNAKDPTFKKCAEIAFA
jgi:hypothetical protein